MAVTINLKTGLGAKEEQWLAKNIGPRMFYLHNSVGGQGWIANRNWKPGLDSKYWTLTFEDERYATFFLIKFPQ